MARDSDKLRVFITSWLEDEHVARMRAVAPDRVEIIHEPDLLAPPRYEADHGGEAGFRRTDEQDARWSRHMSEANVLWDFGVKPGGPLLRDIAPKVGWIQTTSAGVGQTAKRLGLQDSDVIITTASGVHAKPLTEFVFMALLSHVKRLRHIQQLQRDHAWDRFCSDELDGKTLAIIGPGKIGRQIAVAARAFGMRVLAMGRTGGQERSAQLGADAVYARADMHAMLGEADVVVLCVPHTPETEDLMDRAAFNALKPGVMLVNIARGQVVDEDAMLEGLTSGRIAFAALDVFRTEPLPADSPFWDLPNVMINPHSASTASSENRKITDIFCHNLRCYIDGDLAQMQNVLDKQRMY